MTLHAPFIRIIPMLLFAGAALLSLVTGFDGLINLKGLTWIRQTESPFDSGVWPGGYVVCGKVLSWLVADPARSLQAVSWLAFALGAVAFERILNRLSHGSRADSRWMFVVLGLVFSPVFIQSGLSVDNGAAGLAAMLAAYCYVFRWMELERSGDALWTVFWAGVAIWLQPGNAVLLLFPFAVSCWLLVMRGQWRWMALAMLLVAGFSVALCSFDPDWLDGLFNDMQHWSPANFFQRRFETVHGTDHYLLPNAAYVFYPLMHWAFCLPLTALLLLAKKTDLALPSRKLLLFSAMGYLLYTGGLPVQDLQLLLPAYALLLPLFFPAWDRMYCYGFYFFKKLAWSILAFTFIVQLAGNVLNLGAAVSRNRQEINLAAGLSSWVHPGDSVCTADAGPELRYRLPGVRWMEWRALELQPEQGEIFVLSNESLRRDRVSETETTRLFERLRMEGRLIRVATPAAGWTLYRLTSG